MCKSTLHHNQEWSHQEPREVVRNSSPKSFCRHRRRLRFSQIFALRHAAWPLHHVFHIVTLRDIMYHHKCAAGGWNTTASRIDVVNIFQVPCRSENKLTDSDTKLSPPNVKMKRTGSLPHSCTLAATLGITTTSLQKQTTTPDIIDHVPSLWFPP